MPFSASISRKLCVLFVRSSILIADRYPLFTLTVLWLWVWRTRGKWRFLRGELSLGFPFKITSLLERRLQFDFIDREGIEAPAAIVNKDGNYQCKKHALTGKSIILFGFGTLSRVTDLIPLILHSESDICFLSIMTIIYETKCWWSPTECNQCYGWKKQITRLRTQAKKAGKK